MTIGILSLVLVNCGTEKGDSSNVSVKFSKSDSVLSLLESVDTNIAPDVLKIRPLAVRISTDNAGGYMVWGSKSCPGNVYKKKIDDKEYEYADESGCKQSEDNAWLDLTAGTEAVNAELNSQSFPVPPGDYAWVSIIMCEYGTTSDGAQGWIDDSGVATMTFKAGVMTENSEQFHCSPIGNYTAMTPVSIPEGGDIVLNVNYDLSQMVTEGIHSMSNGDPIPWNSDWDDETDGKYVPSDDGQTLKASYGVNAGYQAITITIE